MKVDLSHLFDKPSKTETRMIQIIEGAIKNYATIGSEKTTYDRIARTCKISRPLIQHYFKDKDAVFEKSIQYIRAQYQALAHAAIEAQSTPLEKIRAYVSASLQWVRDYPLHSKTWALFFYHCTIQPKLKALNTDLVLQGTKRISHLVSLGMKEGVFEVEDAQAAARDLQIFLTGAIVTAGTETPAEPWPRFEEQVVRSCLSIIGVTIGATIGATMGAAPKA